MTQASRLLIALALMLLPFVTVAQHADFTADVTSGCLPLTVHFSDQSTGSITTWAWDFGNTNTSGVASPSAVYSTAGTYTVTLTVSNATQSDVKTKTAYITVYDFPAVSFTTNVSSGCTPLAVTFTDNTPATAGPLTNWLWVFGDGATSTDRNPVHSYTAPGDLSVSLQVTNIHSCQKTVVIASPIHVQGPTSDFIADKTVICDLPASIQFTNTAAGAGPLSFSWDFGDGATDTQPNPLHTFNTAGSFNVLLKTKDAAGCTSSQTHLIIAGPQPGLTISAITPVACPAQNVKFNLQGTSAITSYEWNFGNGVTSTDPDPTVTYATAGSYTITLKAKLHDNTCYSVATTTVTVSAPTPHFSYSVACDNTVTFTNTSSGFSRLEWYVENALYSTKAQFTYQYPSAGAYQITLIAYNAQNCSATLIQTIGVPAGPAAHFLPDLADDCTKPSLSGCAPFTIQFTNTSTPTGAVIASWDFGDGQFSVDNNPSHTFINPGIYKTVMTVTNGSGCTSQFSADVHVSNVKPIADFTFDKTTVCTGDTVKFTDLSQNGTSRCWNFGDNTSGSSAAITHSFQKPGVYSISVTSKNDGCPDTKTIPSAITVKGPYIDFGVATSCADPFNVGLANPSFNYTTLLWDFGDGSTSTTDVSSHHFDAVGDYMITLTGHDAASGCTASSSHGATISTLKADFSIDNATPCKNTTVNFTDHSTSPDSWTWSLNGNPVSPKQNPSILFASGGTYNINLSVTGVNGCTDELTKAVVVSNIAADFAFTAGSNCTDLTVQFQDKSVASPAVTGWLWDFGDGQSSTSASPQHVYNALNTYNVTLQLTNTQGTCKFNKQSAVIFTNPEPAFSVSKPQYCVNEKITLNNNSLNALSYVWDFGNGNTSMSQVPQVSYTDPGPHDVTLTVRDAYGCEKSLTKPSLFTTTKPTAAFNESSNSGDCPPVTIDFTDASSPGLVQWQWSFGDANQSVLQNPVYTYLRPGVFNVTLMVKDSGGCTDQRTSNALINVGGPNGTFSTMRNIYCTNSEVVFTAEATNTITYHWDFGDGIVIDGQNPASHVYTRKGVYTPGLVLVDNKGCEVVADGGDPITVNDSTKISFDVSPVCIFEGAPFSLSAKSDDKDVAWSWAVDGVATGTTQLLTVTENVGGNHKVILSAANAGECVSSVSQIVSVQGDLKLIPNVFTPNGDEHNAEFEIEGIENGSWDLHVYNRWGDPVFTAKSYKGDWDGGTLAGGVYFYLLQNQFCKEKTFKGNISIVR